MGRHESIDLISFVLNLVMYPVALSPLALWLFFRKEKHHRPAFHGILRLLLYSTLLAASSSLQLFFNQIEILAELPRWIRELVFQVLSVGFLTGGYLFISYLPKVVRDMKPQNDGPYPFENILKLVAFVPFGLTGMTLLLLAFPPLSGLKVFISVLLPATFITLSASFCHTLVFILMEHRENPHFIQLLLLIGGDLVFLMLAFLLEPLFNPIFFSLFFLYHFWRLYSLLRQSRTAAGQQPSLSGEDMKDRLLAAGLSRRESEIALSLLEGLSYKDISDKCCISLSTVQTHVSRVYGKLGVNSKISLVKRFEEISR